MTHPTDDKLEAMAVKIWREHVAICQMIGVDPETTVTPAIKAAAMLRECKGRDAAAFETGMDTALKCIASLGYGKNHDVDEGHEDAYRAVETYLKDWKTHRPASLEPAPDHAEWNAAIEASIDEIDCGCDGLCLSPHACPKDDVQSIHQLKKGPSHDA